MSTRVSWNVPEDIKGDSKATRKWRRTMRKKLAEHGAEHPEVAPFINSIAEVEDTDDDEDGEEAGEEDSPSSSLRSVNPSSVTAQKKKRQKKRRRKTTSTGGGPATLKPANWEGLLSGLEALGLENQTGQDLAYGYSYQPHSETTADELVSKFTERWSHKPEYFSKIAGNLVVMGPIDR